MALNFEADGVPVELLPKPTGWRVLIAPVKLRKESEGGIALLDDSVKAAEHFRNIAKVLAVGDTAYDHPDFRSGRVDGNSTHWCKVGDIVHYRCQDGVNLTISHNKQQHKLLVITDRNVVSVITDTAVIEALL